MIRQTDGHTRLTASFSGTTWVSWHQKGYTILDFSEARDDDSGSISWSICRSKRYWAPELLKVVEP